MLLGSTSKTFDKSREIVSPVFQPESRYWVEGNEGNVTSWTDDTIPESSDVGRIVYDRGSKVFYKNCYHLQSKTRVLGSNQRRQRSVTANGGTTYGIYNLDCAGYAAQLYGSSTYSPLQLTTLEEVDSLFAPLSDDEIHDLLVKSLRFMIPEIGQITENFSLLNFLFELKDLPSMFEVWSRKDSFIKNLSSGVLNYELGWKPFLADCERIFTKVLRLNEYIDDWNKAAASGEIFSRHANLSKDLRNIRDYDITGAHQNTQVRIKPQSGTPIYCRETGVGPDYIWDWIDDYASNTESFLAHMYFKPMHIKKQFLEDQISIWYDALGLGQGASVIWNAIPFSFVVDWFWSVGDFLEQFKVTTVDVGFEIVDFGYSHKSEFTKSRQLHSGIGGFNDGYFGQLSSEVSSSTKYIRRRCHPPLDDVNDVDWSSLLDFNLPSWKQAWVGTNLLIAVFGK